MNVRWLWILAPLLWSSAAFSDDIDDCNASGDYARAIKGCTSLIIGGNLNRRNAIRAFEHRASAYTETGNIDAAIADYTMVIEFDPKAELTYAFRGRLFGKSADYAAAIADLTKSLELKPGSLAYVDRAQIYETMGDHARAIADYTKALELDAGSLFASNYYDDHYARGYLTNMLALMDSQQYDFVKLFGFYLFHPASDRLGYWDLTWDAPLHFAVPPINGNDVYDKRGDRDTRWGFGFTYVFRKHVWDTVKYRDQNYQEDHWFVTDVRKQFKAGGMQDETGLCLHILHGSNTTSNFPQRLIHSEELERLFPDYKP